MRDYKVSRPIDNWNRTARTWFDGSVESVDRRLADCRRLLQASRAAVAHEGLGGHTSQHLDRIASLEATEGVLIDQRGSLLTAGNDRHHDEDLQTLMDEGYEGAEYPGHDPRNAAGTAHDKPERHLKVVSAADRRYVELEAAKFIREHTGVPVDELKVRAANKARLETSTFSKNRSESITAAFVERVASLYRPVRRTAAAPAVVHCADEMMFI
jgi:hypothetical protein